MESNISNKVLAEGLIKKIHEEATEPINIMEVCGTHTRSIYEHGINKIIPENIKLISGPGCPVCVSPRKYIDAAIKLASKGIIIATFGDMVRVPGSFSTLQEERSKGGQIEIIYSPLDCLSLAENNPHREIVFMGVGFETTAPTIALLIEEAKKKDISNFSVLISIKTMPRVMEKLLLDKELKIDGFLCPGHVSTIIGTRDFQILAQKYEIPMCIAGFEGIDILEGILSLVNMIKNKKYCCENIYSRFVRNQGNIKALELINKVFIPCDSNWRGLGKIGMSGYDLKEEYEVFDAIKKFSIDIDNEIESKFCLCGDIIKGKSIPKECKLYGGICTPQTPVGPCMVSMEGTCNIFYSYEVM